MRTVAALAIAPMVGVTFLLALTSDHLQHPVESALYFGYLTAASMGTGLYWWARRPSSKFGPLLLIFGVLAWMVSWEASKWPLAFDLAVLVEAPYFVLTFYLFLAFPMGRLDPPSARWLMAALGLGALAFFLPWALFSPAIAGGGPLTACLPHCPANVLQIGSAPHIVDVAGHAETYTALAVTVAVLIVYAARVVRASRAQRRALLAVALTSLLFLPAYFASNFASQILKLDAGTLGTLNWIIVVTRVLLPLGFLVVLLQAERFASTALRELIQRLGGRPAANEWRRIVADALGDPLLKLGYYDPGTDRTRDTDGKDLDRPPAGSHRRWIAVERDGHPVAAMVVDETLVEDPELVEAAATATLLAVENGHLEGELRASRARILEAAHAERRRIVRDIHDSAQNRLVALRISLSLLGEQAGGSADKAALERLGTEVDETIDELRTLVRGVYPAVLAEHGIVAALAATTRHSSIPVTISGPGLTRHAEAVELAVYFCCLESVQNTAKHAGARAAAKIRLTETNGHLKFTVQDDGDGFDPRIVGRGAGLTNMADRLAAVGGTLQIDATPGRGTCITGTVPG